MQVFAAINEPVQQGASLCTRTASIRRTRTYFDQIGRSYRAGVALALLRLRTLRTPPSPISRASGPGNRENGAVAGARGFGVAERRAVEAGGEGEGRGVPRRSSIRRGCTPGGACVGYGMPASMLGSGGYPMEWIQRPEQITVVYEAHSEIRRIYIRAEAEPREDLIPSRDGTSFGRWEGDTLVVETIGLKEAVDQSSAHSDQANIVERYQHRQGRHGSQGAHRRTDA